MKKVFCDICGRKIEKALPACFGAWKNNNATPVMHVFKDVTIDTDCLDLCERCHDEINVKLWGIVSNMYYDYKEERRK